MVSTGKFRHGHKVPQLPAKAAQEQKSGRGTDRSRVVLYILYTLAARAHVTRATVDAACAVANVLGSVVYMSRAVVFAGLCDGPAI
jgi:hypothetical protein